MASGKSSAPTDTTSGISEADSATFEMTDEYFKDRKLVLGLHALAAGGKDPNSEDDLDNKDGADSEIFELTDHEEFKDRKLVLGLGAPAGGCQDRNDEDHLASEEGDQVMAADDEKICIGRNNEEVSWGFCMDQGRRRYMEDRIVTFPAFMSIRCDSFGGCTAPRCKFASDESRIHYFAVFDGHGGSQVSDFCAKSLHEEVKKAWDSENSTIEWSERWQSALSRAYNSVDKACEEESSRVGSTALVVLISACQIVAANCGDSRAILCRESHTIPLTDDHKPDRQDEEERIAESGGYVVADARGVMRVDGVLAMSRAIGDKSLKPSVSSVPEFTFSTRTEEDECLLIASDGLWDVMSTELVGDMAREQLRHGRQVLAINESPSEYVAEYLFNEACSRSSTDNFSLIVVDLKPRRMQ